MTPRWTHRTPTVATLAAAALFSQSLFGAGFILQEQSISGLGVGFSSGAAGLSDNSSMYFNPATLTLVPEQQITGGLHVILPTAKFKNGIGDEVTMSTLVPTQGPNAKSDKIAVVPNMYFSRPLSEDLVVGVAMTTPYGLATSYEDGWVGRYVALETDLMTINTNFGFGYQVNDTLSIGAGISVCYGDAILSNALNLGLAFLDNLDPADLADPAVLAVYQDLTNPSNPALGTTKYDGHLEMTGDDIGYGYNFGILFQPDENTRIGLHYRSKILLKLGGEVDFDTGLLGMDPSSPFNLLFQDQGGSVDLELPDTAQASIHYQMTPEWALMADIFHTWWSKFEELNIKFANGAFGGSSVIPEKWEDAWRYSIGTTYQLNEKVQLRGGLVIDESPVPSNEYRSPRIPDEDRFWISLGLGYKMSDQFTLDLAYVYIMVDDPVIDNDTHTPGEHLIGTMDASVNLISIGGSYTF